MSCKYTAIAEAIAMGRPGVLPPVAIHRFAAGAPACSRLLERSCRGYDSAPASRSAQIKSGSKPFARA